MKILPYVGEIWIPRSQLQLRMSADQIGVDNYCREVLQILNKVTPQNIDKLLEKMATLNINNEYNIKALVHYMLLKAENEPLYSELYAEMCSSINQIVDRLTSVVETSETETLCGLFKSLLLKQCEQEFNRIFDIREFDEHSKEGNLLSVIDTHYSYRQKMFGIIIFIGQLYKTALLSENILSCYINRLLDKQNIMSFEFQIECVFKLLRVIGFRIECQQGRKSKMDEYFATIEGIHQSNEFCSRVKFALLDLKDLRANKWIDKWAKAPLTIDEIRGQETLVVSNDMRRKKKN